MKPQSDYRKAPMNGLIIFPKLSMFSEAILSCHMASDMVSLYDTGSAMIRVVSSDPPFRLFKIVPNLKGSEKQI